MHYLTLEQVKKSKKNISKKTNIKSTTEIVLSNIFTFFNLVVLIITILIATTLQFANLISLGIIFFNTAKGIYQEIKAKKSLEKLELLNKQLYKVNRDNKIEEVDAKEIVLGEYLHLNIGDSVPCDSEIIEGTIEVDESALTGEMKSVAKDKFSTVYSGSNIVSGSCLVKVINVGDNNYINKITKKVKKLKKYPSKLRGFMDIILKVTSYFLIPIGLLLGYQTALHNNSYNEIILKTSGSIIGMIPSGLVLLVSATLVVAVMRLAEKSVLIKEEYYVETLSRVNVFCFDKTGTITTGNMKVTEISCDEEKLANYINVFDDENATSKSLKKYLTYKDGWRVRNKKSFSSKNKYSFVQVTDEGTYFLGAFEFLNLDENLPEKYKEYVEKGYRLLTFAKSEKYVDEPKNLEVLGYVVLEDELKNNTKETFEKFKESGVDIKIVSGDAVQTLIAIAQSAGFDNIKAVDLSGVDESNFKEAVLTNNVFGRVTPEQKERIVKILKDSENVVAMSGDGVNDVLALREADISFAAHNSTTAAKNVAGIVFLKDDFSLYGSVLDEGRKVINSIRKVSSLFLAKTIFNIALTIISLIFVKKFPFAPIQLTILMISTVTVPAFLLCIEQSTEKVKGNFIKEILVNAFVGGGILTVVSWIIMLVANKHQYKTELFLIVAMVSGICMVVKMARPFNKYRLAITLGSIVMAIVGVYLNTLYEQKMQSMALHDIILAAGFSSIVIVLHLIFRKRNY